MVNGSLSKAGKVRWLGNKPHLTPEAYRQTQVKDRKTGQTKTVYRKHLKAHKSPRQAKRRAYEKREILERKAGQNNGKQDK